LNEAPFVIQDQPHHCNPGADQWGETGYVLWEGQVHWYSIDRKNQTDELGERWSPEAFLADLRVPEDARQWLRGAMR
jgi:hypothetical protein